MLTGGSDRERGGGGQKHCVAMEMEMEAFISMHEVVPASAMDVSLGAAKIAIAQKKVPSTCMRSGRIFHITKAAQASSHLMKK